MGIPAQNIEEMIQQARQEPKSIPQFVEKLFQPLLAQPLLNDQTRLYYWNNTTMLAPPLVNRVDDMYEQLLRPVFKRFVIDIASRVSTSQQTIADVKQKIAVAYGKN